MCGYRGNSDLFRQFAKLGKGLRIKLVKRKLGVFMLMLFFFVFTGIVLKLSFRVIRG